jgi:hypothetical protein
MPNSIEEGKTAFLNVDLDIISKSRLEPLVAALGKKVIVLHVGRERSRYSAHLELSRQFPNSADQTTRALAALVSRLPEPARKLWNRAQVKDFNIGIQGGAKPYSSEFPLSAQTMDAVVKLGARVVVTVYGALEAEGTRARSSGGKRNARATGKRLSADHAHGFSRSR